MRNRLHLHLLLLILLSSNLLLAQQTPLLARYQFAPQIYNPASVGLAGQLNVGAAWRSQWLGMEDAPTSQVLYADQSLGKVGLGLSLTNDQAGPLGISDFCAAYAYQLPLSADWSLRGGLSVSMANWRSDWSSLRKEDIEDPVFLQNINRFLPNFGTGIVLAHPRFQAGIGIPRLFEYELNEGPQALAARTFRHFYATASGNFPVNDGQIRVQPQLVLGSATWLSGLRKAPNDQINAPTAADLGVSILLMEQWRMGVSWRTALQRSLSSDHALSLQAGWNSPKGIRVSAAYDLPLNAIRQVSDGSFEVMLSYYFSGKKTAEAPTPVTPPAPKPQKSTPKPAVPKETQPVPLPKETPAPPPAPAPTPAPQESDKSPLIQGIVFDMTSGLPFENARVTISNTCGGATVPALITTADGRYWFTALPDCCYIITAQKDGYKEAVSEKICTPNTKNGQILRADLDLYKR